MSLAIVAITPQGAQLARQLGVELAPAQVYLPAKLRAIDDCNYFERPLAVWLPGLYQEVEQLLCTRSTGSPGPRELKGKNQDPSVVILDDGGCFAVSLLSGQPGGADELARRVAAASGATPVITTSDTTTSLPTWEWLAQEAGLTPEPQSHLPTLNRLLQRGEPVALVDQQRRIADKLTRLPGVTLHDNFAAASRSSAAGLVFVSHRFLPHLQNQPEMLALRPRDLVVGLESCAAVNADELDAALRHKLKQSFLAFGSIAAIAASDELQAESDLIEFAARMSLALQFYSADQLSRVEIPCVTMMPRQKKAMAGNCCEAAALLAAGHGELLIRRQQVGSLSIAVAEILN